MSTDPDDPITGGEAPTLRVGPSRDDASVAVTSEPLEPDARYEIRELIARGGMGEVHLAFDVHLRREVALKTLRPEIADRRFAERFAFEARVAGQLEHPNIVPVHDYGESSDGRPFYTMRRIRGRSLAELVAEGMRCGSWRSDRTPSCCTCPARIPRSSVSTRAVARS